MPTVQLPDGRVVQFPDTMTDEQINAVLASEQSGIPAKTEASAAPAQISGVLRAPAMLGSELVKGLDIGLGFPGDLAAAAHAGAQRLGALDLDPLHYLLPTSQGLTELTGRLGLTDRSDLIPGWGDNPTLERFGAAAARGAGAAVPSIPLGGEGTLTPTLLAGAGGGLGDEAGQEAHGGAAGGTLLGLLTGAFTGKLGTVAQRGLSLARGELGPMGQTFSASGLPWRSPALTSEAPLTSLAPFAPREATHADIAGQLSSTASSLGSSVTLQDAGSYAQRQARDWLATTLPAKEALAWGPVDKAIPADAPTPLTNFSGVLKAMTSKGGSLAQLVSQLQPALPAQLYKNLQKTLGSLTGEAPSWQDVRALRSAIGAAMSEPSIAPRAGAKNLTTLYAAITQDLGATAQAHNAGDLFSAANAESTRLHSFAENIIGKMVSGKTPSPQNDPVPEKVAGDFLNPARLKKGGSDLATLNSELPDVTNELSAAWLHQLTQPKTGTVGGGLTKTWAGVSPEAKAALFPPAVRSKLEALNAVASRLGSLPAASPPSSFAAHGGGIGTLLSLAGGGAYSHLTGHPIGLENLAEIAGGSGLFGSALGAARNRVLATAANSPLAARFAATPAPAWLLGRLGLPVSAGAGVAGNELEPRKPGR